MADADDSVPRKDQTDADPSDQSARLGRLPRSLPGCGTLTAFSASRPATAPAPLPARAAVEQRNKMCATLTDAFDACEIGDGSTLSFHHHYRNGDRLVNAVMAIAARRGLQGLRIPISSVFPVHAPLAGYIRQGVIGSVWTDYAQGPVAEALLAPGLSGPVVFQSHGGRARALSSGQLSIDAAFIAASTTDRAGGASGMTGPAACGPLGYAMVDAAHARRVVVAAQEIRETPLDAPEIPAGLVDHVVRVPDAGAPSGIEAGTMRVAEDEIGLRIARQAADVAAAAGLFGPDFSFQTGAGGISLAAAREIGSALREAGLQGDFISGGITGVHVGLVREGLFREMHDVQCFDRQAVASSATDPWHHVMSAAEYASPIHPHPIVDRLSVVVLGAAEIDRAFNINVLLSGDGRIIGGPGGHPDTAAGARLVIATTRLTGGGFAKVVETVRCIVTPGRDVDVVVTEAGIAVNAGREELRSRLLQAGLPVVPIEALIARAAAEATRPHSKFEGDLAALVEYRDGRIIDAIFRPA